MKVYLSTVAKTRSRILSCWVTGVLLLVLAHAGAAFAGIHTWDVVEVFSNADGTIQYVELLDRGTTGGELGVGNGALSSSLHAISWSNGPVTGPTNGRSYLIATAAFAALPGAPVPDVIIPPANVPFFNIAGDTIAFGPYDTLVVPAVPTNGTDSYTEFIGVGPNTPKNYANVEGNVNAGPGTPVPMGSGGMLGVLAVLMSAVGVAGIQRRRSLTAARAA